MSDKPQGTPTPKLAVNLPFASISLDSPVMGELVTLNNEQFKIQLVKIGFDDSGTFESVSDVNPMPVSIVAGGGGPVTQGTVPWVVSGTVTSNQGTSPWVVSGTVAVTQSTSPWVCDTELPAAAALADAASATPTTPTVGAVPLLMNATTVDRQRAVVAGLDSTGTGIAASGLVGQLDDVATSAVTENQFAVARISTRRAQLIEGVSGGTAVTTDTELPAAVALADAASATPTTPTVGAVPLLMNATTIDRARAVVNGLDSTGTGVAASGIVAQLDDVATSAVTENQYASLRMSTRRALLIEGVASGTNINVNIAASGATVTVDTELPAAAALADASSATPTTPTVGSVPMLMNATTIDRQRAVLAGLDSTGIGIAAAGLVAQLDDVATSAVTENQFASLRLSSRRALLIEGVASGTAINVDTELPAAAALADAASATPTTPTVGAVPLLMNATTIDRQRAVVNTLDSTGTGIAASGIVAQLDDVATSSVTENQFASLRMSTRRALLIEGVASGTNINVNIAASGATVTVDTELPAAAALADASSATPTTPTVGAVPLLMNATTIDRQRAVVAALDSTGTGIAAAGLVGQLDDVATSSVTENQFAVARISTRRAILIEGVASGTAVTVDTELPAAVTLADAASATPTTPTVGAVPLLMNATTIDRQRAVVAALDSTGTGIAAAGLVAQLDDVATTAVTENQFAPVRLSTRRALLIEGVASGTNINVNIAASGATVTVDTELPAAAALADAASATPTTPTVGSVPLLMNATTIDRQRAVVNSLDSTGTGIAAAGLVAQLDDTGTSSVTENQFAAVRLSTRRALLVEGVASGTAINVSTAGAQGSFTDKSGTIASGGVSQTLSASNASRKYFIVQNLSSENLWIDFGTAAVASQPSLKLTPDSSFTMESNFINTQAINIIGATTSSAYAAKEG